MSDFKEAFVHLYDQGKITPEIRDSVIKRIKSGEIKGEEAEAIQYLLSKSNIGPAKVTGVTATNQEKPGMFDYLKGAGEVALTVGTGTISEPLSGYAGVGTEIARYIADKAGITSKTPWIGGIVPEKTGPQVIEDVQKSMTYMPKNEAGKAIGSGIGKVVGYVSEPIGKGVQAVSDYAYEKGGPAAGTAVKTLFHAIPEVLGLKGTKAAKKLALEHLAKKFDTKVLYDQFGKLRPEIMSSIQQAGLDMDSLKDIIPREAPRKELAKVSTAIGSAATDVFGREKKMQRLAGMVNPNKEILKAAEEFGLEGQLLPSHFSENGIYRAIEQGVKSIPASLINEREGLALRSLANTADSLIQEATGVLSKSDLADDFVTRSKKALESIEASENHGFETVKKIIPRNMPIEAKATSNYLFNRADELNGLKYLHPKEKMVLSAMDARTNPTYARLEQYRQEIGMAIKNNTGPFRNTLPQAKLKQLYKALAEDQKAAAYSVGQATGELYELSNNMTVSRYALQDKLTNLIGSDLSKSIAKEAGSAIIDLKKGETKKFKAILDNMPEEIGPEMRKSIIATSLNYAFTQGQKKNKQLSIPGFNEFMRGLNTNKSAKKLLSNELGEEFIGRLDKFHLITEGVERAMQSEIKTGRIMSLPGISDEIDGIFRRLYGVVKKTVSSVSPISGTVASVIDTPIRGARSAAADALLASPRFREYVVESAVSKKRAPVSQKQFDDQIQKLKEFQRWKSTLSESDKFDLALVGTIGFLTNRGLDNKGGK